MINAFFYQQIKEQQVFKSEIRLPLKRQNDPVKNMTFATILIKENKKNYSQRKKATEGREIT